MVVLVCSLQDIIDMKRHARLLQGLSVGTPIPGSDLQRNQELFLRKTTTFLDDHNALYHTATMFKDKKYKPIFTVRTLGCVGSAGKHELRPAVRNPVPCLACRISGSCRTSRSRC